MKTLPITWQRLVSHDGRTCDRCSATENEVKHAVETLTSSLHPLDIEPILEVKELDEKTFKSSPSESNRIWIAGKPIETWLGANVSSSKCCSVCGDAPCRTLAMGNEVYEAIPATLIIKAALIAASQSLGQNPENNSRGCSSGCAT